jgi:hypothetical protein
MATHTIVDYRRQDVRRYDHWHPYWISSGALAAPASDDKGALMFSFPASQYGDTTRILIEKVCFQVVTAFAGGTITVDVGSGTIATNLITTAGLVTLVDADEYIPTASITSGTAGIYFARTGDWIVAKLLMTELTPVILTPADATVPCVVVYVTSDNVITAGAGRVHMLITEVPGV